MKKALKIFKISSLILLSIIILLAISGISYFFITTRNVSLDLSKLDGKFTNVQIYDSENNQILIKNNNYTQISEVSPHIINTFVSVEDKRFFKHKGIDMKRMISAAIKNIGSKSFKEGASTITQQLIKNTHLTNDKTFKRKLSEIRLALKLEEKLTKEMILEKYLNNLYFGSGIYGIHNACVAFFDKEPNEINLSEATILAGVVKNPSKNSPITNFEGAITRQKVIFSVLQNNQTYDENTLNNAKNQEIILKNGLIHNKMYKSFINNTLFESTLILNMSENEIANNGYKIVTYLDSKLQEKMYNELTSYDLNCNYVRASIDNKSLGVTSYLSNLNQLDADFCRQVGSLMKPFSVYLPAYENKMINGLTQILDEKININGYSPTNYNNVYHGYVSVKDSVAHSYNVPAVKLLKELGMDKSVDFLSRYGIDIDNKFKNLSLALGANSLSPLKIASCYASIANNGYYQNANFVKQIIDSDGKVIYTNKNSNNCVVDEDINYLMLDNLLSVAKEGTGRKLSNLPYQIACKTGTVANQNGQNTDAWCCAMTTKDTFVAWDGAKTGEFLEKSHGGSSYPTLSIKDYANFVYSDSFPEDFTVPNSIVKLDVDYEKLVNEHVVGIVDDYFGGKVISGVFSQNNLPKFSKMKVEFNVKNAFFDDIIEFQGINEGKYNIYLVDNNNKILIKSVVCNGDIVKIIIPKDNIFKKYHYAVEYEE